MCVQVFIGYICIFSNIEKIYLKNIMANKTFPVYDYPLKFEIIKKCSVTKARCSRLILPHASLETPQFMPVGTQGALKGILPHQIKELNCNLILGNTYHLGHRPVGKIAFIYCMGLYI